MPLFSDTEGPAPERAATATIGMVMDELISAVLAGQVVYLTGAGGEVVAAVVPVEVAQAGLAALRRSDGSNTSH